STVAGETANSIASWPPLEHGGGERHRGIALGKNRPCRARTSQPRLQHTGAGVRHNPRVAHKMRQDRYGSLLRHAIRNQSPLSHRRDGPRPISADFRKWIFPSVLLLSSVF